MARYPVWMSESSAAQPSAAQPSTTKPSAEDIARRPIDVYAVGNALMDIQAQVGDDVPGQVGFEKGVMTLVDDSGQAKVLQVLHDRYGSDVSRCPGGSAANTVIGLADFGGSAIFAGRTGGDEIGQAYNAAMRELGVEIAIEAIPGAQTGTSVILITPDAERTMLTNLAASATLAADDIAADAIARSKYVYVEGYLFTGEATTEAALRTIAEAREAGTKIAFTMSDPFVVQGFRETFEKLLASQVDLLFCNLEEAQAMTGEEDPMACAAALHDRCAAVALTLGGDGSLLMVDDEAISIDGVPCEAVDTTGAGDMYAAGILYGINNGLSWEQAGRLGSAAAAKVVSQMGARLPGHVGRDLLAEVVG